MKAHDLSMLAMFCAIPQDHVQQYMLPQATSPQEIQLLVMMNGGEPPIHG